MILEIAISLLATLAFAIALWFSRIAQIVSKASQASMVGLSTMMDAELDDDTKEIAVRKAGLKLIVASFSIFWRLSFALAAAAIPIFLFDALDLVSREAVFSLMLRLDYIAIVSIIAIVLAETVKRFLPASAKNASSENRYSTADQVLHVLAFSNPIVLKTASWIEDRLVSTPVQEKFSSPIFITSLARGGTTALLNALHDIPEIATHTYRDMPFLTAPNLWSQLSGAQKRSVERHQRAHGDGLEIDLDSPEAFEEIVWKIYWPEYFHDKSISMWRGEARKPDAELFLKDHMKKIIRARFGKKGKDLQPFGRYCSKNNANIARLSYLKKVFPDCQIVVPLRRPECHAASLMRQHKNFLQRQADDDFIKRYMRDIGHFEFGQIHKPIEFPGFEATRYNTDDDNYWLYYWIQAFREILQHTEHCTLILQEDLRQSPHRTMTALCKTLDVDHGSVQFASYFRSGLDRAPIDVYNRVLYKEAEDLYRELEERALKI